MQNDTDLEQSYEWDALGSKMYDFDIRMFLVLRSTVTVTSVIILAVVVVRRKRTEFLYLATPISFFVAGLFGACAEALFLN